MKVGRFTLLSKQMQQNNKLNQTNKHFLSLKQLASNPVVIYGSVTTLTLSTIIYVMTACGFIGHIELKLGSDRIEVIVDTRPAPSE